MFGMVCAAGMSMLADVEWNRRNMVIFAVSLSIGLGLQLESGSLQYVPETARVLAAEATDDLSGGHTGESQHD